MKTMKTALVIVLAIFSINASAQVLKADVANTEISWLGKKVTGQHNGAIALKSGELTLEGNAIVSGEFVIDMTSIKVLDLDPGEMNTNLVNHLKSDDFFGVEAHPEAKLVITEKATFNGNTASVKGNLTIKGITNPVAFDVKKDAATYNASITIDRSKYDVRYGSGSFFENLGDKAIYDDFVLDIKLVFN